MWPTPRCGSPRRRWKATGKAVEAAEAAIKQAEAAVETAQINLGYTKITAPISGRIGRSDVTEGAIVTAYQPAALATIQQFDPIYVDVPQSTVELNRLKRSLANGRLKENGTDKVKIVLEDGTAYPQEGIAQVPRRDGGPDDRLGHPADRRSQSRRHASARHVRPGGDRRRRQRAGDSRSAAGRVARSQGQSLRRWSSDAGGERRSSAAITTDRAMGDQWLVSSGLAGGRSRDCRGRCRRAASRAVNVKVRPVRQAAARRPRRQPQDRPPTHDEHSIEAKPDGDAQCYHRFFLDRPVFAWVIAIVLMVLGRSGHLQPAHLPVSADRPAVDRHSAVLSGGLGRDGGKQRHPDHRAEDDGLRRHAVSLGHERFGRHLPASN